MTPGSVKRLKERGFVGFLTVKQLELGENRLSISDSKGVYVVLYDGSSPPEFSLDGENGYDGGLPRPSHLCLQSEWVDGADIIYIGQTGGKKGGKLTKGKLSTRIPQYIRHGRRGCGNHGGGRRIWFLKRADELVMCWKPLEGKDDDPKELECEMLKSFRAEHQGRMPFANVQFECPEV